MIPTDKANPNGELYLILRALIWKLMEDRNDKALWKCEQIFAECPGLLDKVMTYERPS